MSLEIFIKQLQKGRAIRLPNGWEYEINAEYCFRETQKLIARKLQKELGERRSIGHARVVTVWGKR